MTLDLPPKDCEHCQRLVAFRGGNRRSFPDRYNGAVPPFGDLDASLLVVGLAPGLKGANFTGRPFTGDYAGVVLYNALIRHGFAEGSYGACADDGLILRDCRITNAVRCVPPQNKPSPSEQRRCNPFLENEIAAMKNLKVILALGRISHLAVFRALPGHMSSSFPFKHGTRHEPAGSPMVFSSYHCSRYNIQTRRLTEAMFDAVLADIRSTLDQLSVKKERSRTAS